jgi:hypothetical protein
MSVPSVEGENMKEIGRLKHRDDDGEEVLVVYRTRYATGNLARMLAVACSMAHRFWKDLSDAVKIPQVSR